MGIYDIFKLIYSFEKETKVELHEMISDSKSEVLINKNEEGLFFKLGIPFFKLLYQSDSNFIIRHNSFDIKIAHFLSNYVKNNFSIRMCKAYIFQSSSFIEKKKMFYSYYSNINKNHFKLLFHTDKDDFKISINNINFKISSCKISSEINHSFLCIECDSKIDFKDFKHYVNNITVSLGFISGRFYKTEEFYFQSNFQDFSEETDFFYRSLNNKYNFPEPFTNHPSNWNWKFNEKFVFSEELKNNWSSYIDEDKFNFLVKLLIKKPRIFFSIRMIFDFYKTPPISRVSLMFVVLETLCEELNVKNTRVEKQLKQEIGIETLNRLKDKISDEDFNILTDIVENIDNKLTNNAVHFEQTLKSLGMNYSNEERNILSKRNDFFHGRIIPNLHQIESEEEYVNLELKYNYYTLRLYVLVSKILLKTIGFKGYLINYPKLFEDDNKMNLKESYFVKI